MTTLIRFDGDLVASVGHTRAYLMPHIEALPDGDPLLRFVVVMCSYALEVAQGRLPGPYSDERAAFFARTALIDDDEFGAVAERADDELAMHFAVPASQIALKRAQSTS